MILRTVHKSNFTTLANAVLRDKTISFKARGLLSYMLSLPDNWMFYPGELESHSEHDGGTAIGSAIQELIAAGYVTRKQPKSKDGKWMESEWEVREIAQPVNPQPVNPQPVNQPLLSTRKRISTESNKSVLQNSSFDPEELPGHFIKHPEVITAWLEFVQHRKETGHKLTPLAHKKITMEMLKHVPDEIVDAINTAITKGWRGLFYKDGPIGNKQSPAKPDVISLDLNAQKLYYFVQSTHTPISQQETKTLISKMKAWYSSIPTPGKGESCLGGMTREWSTHHMPWDRLFQEWVTFLQTKQESFPLRSAHDLIIGGLRWNEFVRHVEHCTGFDWTTGKFIG